MSAQIGPIEIGLVKANENNDVLKRIYEVKDNFTKCSLATSSIV